ncbi:MAG: hypothetical protein M3041_10960 [Acidobacteriota bacterium]|nr:hypothetical protein [Acidobacteriota bacterium]
MRLVRTLGVPLAIAVIFLVFTPKLCERAIVTAKQRQATATVNPVAPSASGLVIQSSTPSPGGRANVRYPAGLDAARIQYLVEIDSTFSAPMTMAVTLTAPITRVLIDRQYVDKNLAPTREGLINVNGAVQSPEGWTVPVAQRKFLGVDGVDDAGDSRYDVWVRWRWEPTATAAPLLLKPQEHHLKAQFAGGTGSWVLDHYVERPDAELR